MGHQVISFAAGAYWMFVSFFLPFFGGFQLGAPELDPFLALCTVNRVVNLIIDFFWATGKM